MRKPFLLSLLVALLTSLSTHAYDFQSGDLYYNITSNTTVEVTYQEYWNILNYRGLTTATIPETVTNNGTTYSVTSIGERAFAWCSALTSITLPNSVTSIVGGAFYGCSSLTSIILPNSVNSIGDDVFAGCTSLQVEDNLRYADTYLVEAVDKSLSTYTIKAGTKWIGKYAFRDCSSLTSITIPNSVISIGYNAFEGCTTLPVEDNLRYADTYLVEAVDKSLSTYTIKAGTKWIGDNAFYACSALADIYCYATTPPACNESFVGVSKHCRIHVPAGTLEAYQWTPEWSDFYHFFEISELPDGAPTDQVGVTVTGNYATFSWPVNPTASSYTLTITKDGEVFCTLIFNNMGQLVGMAFAPARNGEQSANQGDAQSTAYGFSFVVTNLNANSHYTYTFTVNGADSEVIETYSGAFDTTEETTALSVTKQQNKPSRKILRDGQVLILRNGVTYDMMGQTR